MTHVRTTRVRHPGTSSSTICSLATARHSRCQPVTKTSFFKALPACLCALSVHVKSRPSLWPRLFPTFDFVWNITGIILAATSKTCSENMPDVYYSILAFASLALGFAVHAVGCSRNMSHCHFASNVSFQHHCVTDTGGIAGGT